MTKKAAEATLFRVHYNETSIDVYASTPTAAGDMVKSEVPGALIRKVKRVKGGAS